MNKNYHKYSEFFRTEKSPVRLDLTLAQYNAINSDLRFSISRVSLVFCDRGSDDLWITVWQHKLHWAPPPSIFLLVFCSSSCLNLKLHSSSLHLAPGNIKNANILWMCSAQQFLKNIYMGLSFTIYESQHKSNV